MDDHLYGQLAAAIVQDTVDRFEHPPPRRTARPGKAEPLRAVAGTGFSGQPLGDFAYPCEMLVRLGVARVVGQSGSVTHRLIVDGNRVAAAEAERAASGELPLPPIEEVL